MVSAIISNRLSELNKMWALTLYNCGFELVGINAGALRKYACELDILLKCMCHMPNSCDLADLALR